MKDNLLGVLGLISILLLFLFMSLRLPQTKTEIISPPVSGRIERISTGNVVRLYVPAVDENGNGMITTLIVEAVPGKGRVLTDINHLLFFLDTQNSIQIAKIVAQNITGVDVSGIDLIYQIETNATIIGGPSAGAALTIATIAALENKSLNPKVGITGTINLDGSIGPVGSVKEKALACKQAGIEVFLVPKGQGVETSYVPERKCEKIGPILYCVTKYEQVKVDISKSIGINVKEVENIQEALKYFLGEA